MSTQSTQYELTGRTGQKQRTRAALVLAARDLVAAGVSPTVEEAASAAEISRTTAYRYFPNQRALLVAAHPETGASSMLSADPPVDAPGRLTEVIREFTRVVVQTEAQQRTMLRLSLEATDEERAALPLRQGRAIGWIEEALAPLGDRLSEEAIHSLALAIRSAVGIEALAWMTDVAGLSRDDAAELMSWSAQAMLQASAHGNPPPFPHVG